MKKLIALFVAMSLVACSSKQVIVDPKSIKNQEAYEVDSQECKEVSENYSKTGSVAGSSVVGAVAGGGVVAGVATAVAGAVFAPAIPFIIAGAVLTGGVAGGASKSGETEAREKIWADCLNDRGYRAYRVN